jgi:NAD+ synthase
MALRIAIAQANFIVGDISGNAKKIAIQHKKAAEENADLIVFSEMAITAYPAEDLVLRKRFQEEAMRTVEQLANLTKNKTAILVGGLWGEEGIVYNTAFLLGDGRLMHRQYKHNLPNYGVFDEKRVFAEGKVPAPVEWRGVKLGILICEDMWSREAATRQKIEGAELLISINASPYEFKKQEIRTGVAIARVKETGLPLIYVNQVGGQDELVFDGNSFAMSAKEEIKASLKGFEEDFAVVTWDKNSGSFTGGNIASREKSDEETIYKALMLGLRDYVQKNRFAGVLLGLSGGIDSALVAAVAADALGAEHVNAIMMPSPYTSQESLEDAEQCARALGIHLDTIPIFPAMEAFDEMLAVKFAGKAHDTTEENIQSRLRGNILMAVSNKFGHLLLTTGNKSEMSVGYATLYGDMCGGYNILKDVYKTMVYKLARWRNAQGKVIPERILTKAPSAELKPNQTDQDSLPPYDLLDAILVRLIEQQMPVVEIAAEGYDRNVVERVAKMLFAAEYKRRQAPPGVKITAMSFGRDRRYPLTNGWNA